MDGLAGAQTVLITMISSAKRETRATNKNCDDLMTKNWISTNFIQNLNIFTWEDTFDKPPEKCKSFCCGLKHCWAGSSGGTKQVAFYHIQPMMLLLCVAHLHLMAENRDDSRFTSSQWETVLLCNNVSHWLGASLESITMIGHIITTVTQIAAGIFNSHMMPVLQLTALSH